MIESLLRPSVIVASVGVDAEPNELLSDGVAGAIATAGEAAMLAELSAADPSIYWGRLLFSAKRSVYKARYPLTGRRHALEPRRDHR